MSTATEVIAVVTQVDGIIDDMKVFTDNDTAENVFIGIINEYRTSWAESFGTNTENIELSKEEVNIILEEGYYNMGDTLFSIVHSSNNIRTCSCNQTAK